jgi:phage terminase small subunit
MTRPAKPAGLVTRHLSTAEKSARYDNEAAFTPKNSLPMNPPARLKGHRVASTTYRRLMRVYAGLSTQIITGLDWVLLENFCLAFEELDQLKRMRKFTYDAYQEIEQAFDLARQDGETNLAVSLAKNLVRAYDAVLKVDARMDRNRTLLHQLGQSLYVTPRARAGTAPTPKENDEVDPMEAEMRRARAILAGDQ